MVQATADATKQRVILTYTGKIGAQELERTMPVIKGALAEMKPGFSLLTDMTALDSMDWACAPYIEQVMDWCDDQEIAAVVRVIPDPKKDIGFTIMSRFHYRRTVKLQTYESLADAVASLI